MLALVLAAAPLAPAVAQTSAQYDTLAHRIVTSTAAVTPGELVVVHGGPHTVPLMESIAVEVVRAGGVAFMRLGSDRVTNAYFREAPARHLAAVDTAELAHYASELQHADVYVWLPRSQDPGGNWRALMSDTARMATVMKTWEATQARYDRLRNTSRARFVVVDYPPMQGVIAQSGLDPAEFTRRQWAALTADYGEIERQGRALARLLQRGSSVRVTTPAGTDLRLRLAGRRPVVEGASPSSVPGDSAAAAHRTTTLPGGRVAVAPDERSSNGRVVIPREDCNGAALVNARFELRDGRMRGFAADSGGACVTDYLASSASPADVLGQLSIGLNPAIEVVETGIGYRPWAARGVVGIAIGNNRDIGGTIGSPAGHGFSLLGATVEIDGQVVVRDGKLVMDVAQRR